jgi:hypothetical protein
VATYDGGVSVAGPSGIHDVRFGPRVWQTLGLLLSGRSEKESAAALGVSQHTAHCYVKSVYRLFGASTRAELMARFIPEVPPMLLAELVESGRLHRCRVSAEHWLRVLISVPDAESGGSNGQGRPGEMGTAVEVRTKQTPTAVRVRRRRNPRV